MQGDHTWVQFLCLFSIMVSLGLLVHIWFCCATFSFFSTMLIDWQGMICVK